MANFNQKTSGNKTENKSGHIAFKMKDKEKLVTQVLTTFFGEPKYYGDNTSDLVNTAEFVVRNKPDFVRRLALFTRHEFNLRSVSHVLTAILANATDGKKILRKLCNEVVVRADDISEILSAYMQLYGKPIPNSLKKGLGDAFKKFDEYQLAKYKGERDTLKMRDVLRICHPKPNNKEQSDLWKRLINKELETPYTWETELSEKGNTKEVWEDLVNSRKMGYMAILRNLRNIINAKIQPEFMKIVYDTLADKEQVLKSRQLPFRFLSAYKELEKVDSVSSMTFDMLEKALAYSTENIPKLLGKTAIIVDVSGSMDNPISAKSRIKCLDIGLLLGVIAVRICEDSIFLTFANNVFKQTISSTGGIISQMRSIKDLGGGTSLEKPFEYLLEKKIKVDRIILLSDNEINSNGGKTVQSNFDKYNSQVNPDCWVHAIDLQGYGTQQFMGAKTNIIAGWSEKVFDFIQLAERGIENLVKKIENYEVSDYSPSSRK